MQLTLISTDAQKSSWIFHTPYEYIKYKHQYLSSLSPKVLYLIITWLVIFTIWGNTTNITYLYWFLPLSGVPMTSMNPNMQFKITKFNIFWHITVFSCLDAVFSFIFSIVHKQACIRCKRHSTHKSVFKTSRNRNTSFTSTSDTGTISTISAISPKDIHHNRDQNNIK